jgi:hypothetical protein
MHTCQWVLVASDHAAVQRSKEHLGTMWQRECGDKPLGLHLAANLCACPLGIIVVVANKMVSITTQRFVQQHV